MQINIYQLDYQSQSLMNECLPFECMMYHSLATEYRHMISVLTSIISFKLNISFEMVADFIHMGLRQGGRGLLFSSMFCSLAISVWR